MPHPIEIPNCDRFVELRVSAEEMQIHRLLQTKACRLCEGFTFDLGAEAANTAASATFPALTLGHVLRRARVDGGEMGPRPDKLKFHTKEGRSLVANQPRRELSDRCRRRFELSTWYIDTCHQAKDI